MFKLNSITVVNQNTINYNYTCSSDFQKYFNLKEPFFAQYDTDISAISPSVLVVPLLSNIAPISWFAGFDIFLDELDEDFYNSLRIIKAEFVKNYPQIKNESSQIHVKQLIKNKIEANNSAMLFSGGVDAYATYFRQFEENLDLITIHGADVDLKDVKQWETVVRLNENEGLLDKNNKHYIKSNLQTFYTYHVDLLLKDLGWWGKVQHGLALNCLLAPLSMKFNYFKIYIASSYTDNINIAWGSTPEIDNAIQWANVKIVHDGYELKRQDKVSLIVKKSNEINKKINLRVCYSEAIKEINCSKCEKCYRTIIGIILSGDNPNNYGFVTSENVYDEVRNYFSKGFYSKGAQYFWWEINEKIKEEKDFFIFSNKEIEIQKMDLISNLITKNTVSGFKKESRLSRVKHRIQKSFPKIFKIYLKLRQAKL